MSDIAAPLKWSQIMLIALWWQAEWKKTKQQTRRLNGSLWSIVWTFRETILGRNTDSRAVEASLMMYKVDVINSWSRSNIWMCWVESPRSRNAAWFAFALHFIKADQTSLTTSCSFNFQLQHMRPKGGCHCSHKGLKKGLSTQESPGYLVLWGGAFWEMSHLSHCIWANSRWRCLVCYKWTLVRFHG